MNTVYIFFADGFEEIEALATVDILRRADINVKTTSVTESNTVTGAHNIPVICDTNIKDCLFEDIAMAILPGGMPGAQTLGECEPLKALLMKMATMPKPIAAICAAPMVLGKLGILSDKRSTCYPGFENFLLQSTYTGALVERDGNIITGKGPAAAAPFAFEIVKLLTNEQKVEELKAAMQFA